jgi:hypothetical protein
MSKGVKGKKRRQKGEYTRQRPSPPPAVLALPPERMERVRHVVLAYMMVVSVHWLWEVNDVEDVPTLWGATNWLGELDWPESEKDLWAVPPLLEREPAS